MGTTARICAVTSTLCVLYFLTSDEPFCQSYIVRSVIIYTSTKGRGYYRKHPSKNSLASGVEGWFANQLSTCFRALLYNDASRGRNGCLILPKIGENVIKDIDHRVYAQRKVWEGVFLVLFRARGFRPQRASGHRSCILIRRRLNKPLPKQCLPVHRYPTDASL